MRSTEIVTAFWEDVWNAHEPNAVDRFVAPFELYHWLLAN